MCYNVGMRYLALFALAICLTACAGEPKVYAVIQERAYTPSEFRFASQHKVIPTIISGNPFPMPDRQVHGDILAAMQPANWWFSQAFTPRTRFSDAPADRDTSLYRVYVSIDDSETADPETYCMPSAGATPKKTPGNRITARMAFCRDRMLLSTSHGTVDDIDGSTHPRFQAMMTRMTMALFPQRKDDGDCRPLTRRQSC